MIIFEKPLARPAGLGGMCFGFCCVGRSLVLCLPELGKMGWFLYVHRSLVNRRNSSSVGNFAQNSQLAKGGGQGTTMHRVMVPAENRLTNSSIAPCLTPDTERGSVSLAVLPLLQALSRSHATS